MAQFVISTSSADPVRPYLEGVAKSLVDRLYGENGPAWGTKLSVIEETIGAIRLVLSEKMLDEALQRQADAADERPAEFQCCPKCGKEVQKDPDKDDKRILPTTVGEAEWTEPGTYCRKCRRAFYPQSKSLGIDRTGLSPTLQAKVVRAGTKNSSFAQGSEDLLDYLQLEVDPKQVERVTERIGAERCDQRDAEVERYMSLPLVERKDKPKGVVAPALAVVSVDGGRLQIRGEPKVSATGEKEASAADDAHKGKHWREDKIGLLMTMKSEEQPSDPCPEVPSGFVDPTRIAKLARELKTKKSASVETTTTEVAGESDAPEKAEEILREQGQAAEWEPPEVMSKHLTATRRPWASLGPMVATKAWELGFYQAPRQAFVGDGGENVWTVWRNHFSSFTPILDIIHAISYLFAGAMAGRPFTEGWVCYERWMTWVWKGEVEKVIAEMAARQAELGAVQEGDGDTHPRVIVGTALRYMQNNKDKMRYAEYRRRGMPITSSYVESAVKQFNQRVKGTEKFWTEEGAEALLQLRADYLGPTIVLDEFWKDRQNKTTGQNSYTQAV